MDKVGQVLLDSRIAYNAVVWVTVDDSQYLSCTE